MMEPETLLLMNESAYEIGKQSAISYFKKYQKKINLSENNYKNLMNLFEILGLGMLQIIKADSKSAMVSIKESVIAEQFLKKNKKSTQPVCDFTSGFLAGLFSFMTNSKADVKETMCLASGKTACTFQVKW